MPADVFSSGLGYLSMGTGNDNNSWGDNCNVSVFQIFEDAISNTLSLVVTGGTLDLSGAAPPVGPSGARHHHLSFTGALLSNQIVIVPNLSKTWWVSNGTSGSFVLQMKTPTGTAIQIPQGMNCWVCCISNIVFRLNARTGEISEHATANVPPGAILCDGRLLSRTDYNELFTQIGTTWGAGDGFTTFAIPNTRDTGRYLRSATGSVAVGTYQASQNLSHTHTGTATVSGNTLTESNDHVHFVSIVSGTSNQDINHVHNHLRASGNIGATKPFGGGSEPFSTYVNAFTDPPNFDINQHNHSINGNSQGISATHTHAFNGSGTIAASASGGSESRPETAVVMMCIWI
jgi:microcystin-dependent protein